MLSRQRPIQQRLIHAYGLFSGVLLLCIWLASIAYFHLYERSELLQTLRTQVAMLATQASAAVLFGDEQALAEDLATLRHVNQLRWAVIVDPAPPYRQLAGYGTPPPRLQDYLDRFDDGQDAIVDFSEATVRQAIMLNDRHRADLLINLDMRQQTNNLMQVVVISLLLNLLFLGAATIVFNRIVLTVAQPVHALVRLADKTGAEGIPTERAAVDGDDELGRLGGAFNRMLDNLALRESELARSRDELRALSQRLQQVREGERTRISHEIHDELGQRMTALKFEVARLPDDAARMQLSTMIDDTLKVIRTISWELRPSLLDSVGLAAAIEWLGHDFQQRMGIRCGIDLPTEPVKLDPAQATDVFRICQELLTNIARHAHASRADIWLGLGEGWLHLDVRDNGVGMKNDPLTARSLGLIGIRERAHRWGGRVEFASPPDGTGTIVGVLLPVAGPADDHREAAAS